MIKLTFCLRRRPGMSRGAFQTYWKETHAPLAASVAETIGCVRYVQTHALDHDVNQSLKDARGGETEMYDGVAELWWESWETFFGAGGNDGFEDAAAALVEDERKFIDLANSPIWFNEEHVIVG